MSYRAPKSEPIPRSELARMFDSLSTSELAIYIARFGERSLPRLTDHTRRLKEAMEHVGKEMKEMEARELAKAVAAYQAVYDATHQCPSRGQPRSKKAYPCASCGRKFHPLKSQEMRGNGLYCDAEPCRKAARDSRKKSKAA